MRADQQFDISFARQRKQFNGFRSLSKQVPRLCFGLDVHRWPYRK